MLLLTLGIFRVTPLFDLSERDWSNVASMEWRQTGCYWWVMWVSKRVLKSILNFTGNQWRECSSGTLQINGGDFVTTRASLFWKGWSLVRSVSAILDRVISHYSDQGNATYPGYGKTWAADHRYMRVEGEFSSNTTPRLQTDFAGLDLIPTTLIGNREIFAPLSFIPDREEFSCV